MRPGEVALVLDDGDLAHLLLGGLERQSQLFACICAAERALASLEGFRATPFETPEQVRSVQDALRDNLRRATGFGVPLALGTDVNMPIRRL